MKSTILHVYCASCNLSNWIISIFKEWLSNKRLVNCRVMMKIGLKKTLQAETLNHHLSALLVLWECSRITNKLLHIKVPLFYALKSVWSGGECRSGCQFCKVSLWKNVFQRGVLVWVQLTSFTIFLLSTNNKDIKCLINILLKKNVFSIMLACVYQRSAFSSIRTWKLQFSFPNQPTLIAKT